ncbi:thiol:disulfide interchange protein [Novosphingobium barchaimii LL02]|uniref:Thiol:disulfide interchange protein n=1 Tax=Novosphingobium barchaimii LL02 TaxID=1114963 RepID=A0A0J7XRL8_9SPHN|nr:protein-disulfide reductase DsbD domain-containing protein [Novosphingobium barchaimii]KMS54317.1 thiol:disulfide interchange protein [Novosphingobium barchaimii LL02]
MTSRRYAALVTVLCQLTALLGVFLASALPAQAAPTHIAAELVAGPIVDGKATLAIRMSPEKGWHGYWINPGDAGLGMQLAWELPEGASVGEPAYPVPRTLVVQGLMNHVYEKEYAVLVPVTLPEKATAGTRLPVRVKAQWLACTEQLCVPERAELATEIVVGAAPDKKTAKRFDEWTRALPAPLDAPAAFALTDKTLRLAIPLPASVKLEAPHLFVREDKLVNYAAAQMFSRKGDVLLVTIPRPDFASPAAGTVDAVLRLDGFGNGIALTAKPGPVPTGGEPVASDTEAPELPALPWLLLAAVAGGLLLNVMPCVFPILSLKALSLARAGESEAHARVEGLAYSAGVITACLILGAALLALRAGGEQVGWAFQLQEPAVVVALFVLAAAITANLLGLFEFAVPGFASGGSAQGSFATGLLAAFVATPCTGPFMASAMGAALLLPVAPALTLFAALGLGIALPFLAIAFVPALRRRLPRPGKWMVTFRRIMAVPMALTALALAWLVWRLGGAATLSYVLALAAMLLALLALAGRNQRRGRPALIPACLALAVLAVGVLTMPEPQHQPGETASIINAKPFSAKALAKAQGEGRPVFVWMTADWCLTCKVNEEVAIEREDTKAAFEKAGVVVLRGDWTRRDPEITRYLTARGAAGVPLYVWYAKGAKPETLPQVLTPALLAQKAGS